MIQLLFHQNQLMKDIFIFKYQAKNNELTKSLQQILRFN